MIRSKVVPLHAQSMSWQATFASGAKQLVVHEAFDTTSMLLLSYFFSFTPITNMGASLEGAEMMTCSSNSIEHGYSTQSCNLCKSRANSRSSCTVVTPDKHQSRELTFLAPPLRWREAFSISVNTPETQMRANEVRRLGKHKTAADHLSYLLTHIRSQLPQNPRGSPLQTQERFRHRLQHTAVVLLARVEVSPGFLQAWKAMCFPSTSRPSLLPLTVPVYAPCTVSYLNMYAAYSGSQNGSLMATT